jgi:uncharacterized membrane protein
MSSLPNKTPFVLDFSLKRFVGCLSLYLLLDLFYLGPANRYLYKMDVSVRDVPFGSIAWVPLSLLVSSVKGDTSKKTALLTFLIGFTAYSVFNGTELAINERWRQPFYKSMVDIAWGSFASSFVGFATHRL